MKRLLCALTLICGLRLLAADSTIGNLSPITTVPDNYKMPWESTPAIADFHITFANLTNQILSGIASQSYANSAASSATNGLGSAAFKATGFFDVAGSGTSAAQAATNGFPWGVLYDSAGRAQAATNGFPWMTFGLITGGLNYTPLGATSNAVSATTASYVSGTLTNVVTNFTATAIANAGGNTNSATQLSSGNVAFNLLTNAISGLVQPGTSITITTNANGSVTINFSGSAGAPLNGTNVWTGTNTFTGVVNHSNTVNMASGYNITSTFGMTSSGDVKGKSVYVDATGWLYLGGNAGWKWNATANQTGPQANDANVSGVLSLIMDTNGSTPAAISGHPILWWSNYVLYAITPLHTNYVCGP